MSQLLTISMVYTVGYCLRLWKIKEFVKEEVYVISSCVCKYWCCVFSKKKIEAKIVLVVVVTVACGGR